MSNFLPNDYQAPDPGPSKWMKIDEPGTYRIRIQSPAAIGMEYWDKSGEKAKVYRVKDVTKVPEEYIKTTDNKKKAKEFWGFVVYNYEEGAVQVLTITQLTIMRGIIALMEDADFGKLDKETGRNDVTAYDIKIKKDDTNGRITYQVTGAPPKELDATIKEMVESSEISEKEVYTDASEAVKTEEVPDKVPV